MWPQGENAAGVGSGGLIAEPDDLALWKWVIDVNLWGVIYGCKVFLPAMIEHGEGAFCTFDANAFHFKKLQLRASFASPALFGPKAVQLLQEKVVDGDAIVSHRFPLGRIQEAMDTARRDPAAVKVVVMP